MSSATSEIPINTNTNSTTTSEIPITSNTNSVIVLNTHSSLKLNSSNFPAWHVQFNALLVGYDLIGYVDGTGAVPATTDAAYTRWKRQDQLILHAIISSVDPSVITMLGNVKTSKQAWDILTKMFAKERLSRFKMGSKSISEYLQGIKALSDELAIINSPLDDVDLVIHTLNGLGTEYREVTAALRTRENPIGFDDLHDLLSDFESYLKRDEIVQETPLIATANSAHKGKQFYNKTRPTSRPTSPASTARRVVCQF
jgi:serine/threonine protein kinase